jgi:allophanate hydrolase
MLKNLPFTIEAIHQAYRDEVSVHDVINESLERLKISKDKGIYLYICSQVELADMVEDLGPFDLVAKPLWGIPFAVKDNIDVAGLPTTAGCSEFSHIAKSDAAAVELLKKAGAIVIGKTNLDQFATGLVGLRTPFTAPKNAIDEKLIPGGSSSGSAVAVALGQVAFSLGTDTAGSGRIPAALNNIVGLKPSLGSISNRGVVPACRTLDTVSIFALTVDDAMRVYSCCQGFDPQDPYSKAYEGASFPTQVENIVIGIPNESSLLLDEKAQADSYRDAIEYWKQSGAVVKEVDFAPFYEVAKLLYEGPWVAERWAVIEPFVKQYPDALHPVTRQVVERAKDFSASDAFSAQYRLKELSNKLAFVWEEVDTLCVPSMPGLVYTSDVAADPIAPNSRLGTYTNFVNLLNLCAIAAPGKPRADGYPSSITLIAPTAHDAYLATLARQFHNHQAFTLGATDHPIPKKVLQSEDTSIGELLVADEFAIAVVGVHMKGLPLNHQLTNRGGRLLIMTKTSPHYSLFKLGDEKPLRPGLVHTGQGASIELEVWALPKMQLADFIGQIPSPLSIGTIGLIDGQQVKGFLCESIGTKSARDISEFGGWRSFCDAEEGI